MAKRTRKEVLRWLGGNPAKVSQEIAAFGQDARVLSSGRPRLIDEYAGEWVGVFHNSVAAHAPDHDELMKLLAERNIPSSQTIVRFIDRNEKTFIL